MTETFSFSLEDSLEDKKAPHFAKASTHTLHLKLIQWFLVFSTALLIARTVRTVFPLIRSVLWSFLFTRFQPSVHVQHSFTCTA